MVALSKLAAMLITSSQKARKAVPSLLLCSGRLCSALRIAAAIRTYDSRYGGFLFLQFFVFVFGHVDIWTTRCQHHQPENLYSTTVSRQCRKPPVILPWSVFHFRAFDVRYTAKTRDTSFLLIVQTIMYVH